MTLLCELSHSLHLKYSVEYFSSSSLPVWVILVLFSFTFTHLHLQVSLSTTRSLNFHLSPSSQLLPSLSSLPHCHSPSPFLSLQQSRGYFYPECNCSARAHTSLALAGCCLRLHSTAPPIHSNLHAHIHTHTHTHTCTHVVTTFTSMQDGGGLCSWRLTRRRERWQAEEVEAEEGKKRRPLGGGGKLGKWVTTHMCVHTQ